MNITYHLVNNRGNLGVIAPNALEELTVLVRNVKANTSPVTEETLCALFEHGGDLAIACDGTVVIAMVTIAREFKINGSKPWLEHVSVLPPYQKQGIAEKLSVMLTAKLSTDSSLRYVDLTCEPSREGANRLYERLGFKLRITNSRRLDLTAAR